MADRWFRVVYVTGQGYGTMTPEAWDAMSENEREGVDVLELLPDQRSATARYRRLVRATGESEWQDKPRLRWEDTGLVTDGLRLYAPADEPLPEIEVNVPAELVALADIMGRPPLDRTCAEMYALDWYATR